MQVVRIRILFFLFTLFSVTQIFGQDKERLHSALEQLKTAKDDTTKVYLLNSVGWDTSYDNLAIGLSYCLKSLELAEQIRYDRGIIRSCNSIGTIYVDMGDVNNALKYHLRGLSLAEKNNEIHLMTTSLMNISILYVGQSDYKTALDYLHKSLKISLGNNDSAALAGIYENLGGIYLNWDDSTKKAKECFDKAIIIASKIHKTDEVATDLGGLGKCYQKLGDTLRSDNTMIRAIIMLDSLHLDYALSSVMVNYAQLLSERGFYKKAEQITLQALLLYQKIGMRKQESELYMPLANIYEKMGLLQKSVDTWKKYTSMRDSLINEDVMRHQRDLEAVYENEKKENEIKLNENKIKLLTQSATLNRTIVIALVGGCLLLLLFLFVLFNRSKLRKRTNIQLEKQKSVIEEKNKDITDSINYARRIQEAILPTKELKYQIFPNAFILFRPRDIVSGDFYWFAEKNGRRLIAAVDCTGHGVPGAFMSMIGNAFLNEIVNEKGITKPSEILNLLRQNVVNALKQSEAESENKDGMDIALCSFAEDFSSVEFAGAFNPMWLIRNGEIKIYPSDKEPVGFQSATSTPFTNHEIELQKGDAVYIFSDGYADQFGGPRGKKMKALNFQKTLLSIQHKAMSEQELILIETFEKWKGSLEQVDDVIVIGVKI